MNEDEVSAVSDFPDQPQEQVQEQPQEQPEEASQAPSIREAIEAARKEVETRGEPDERPRNPDGTFAKKEPVEAESEEKEEPGEAKEAKEKPSEAPARFSQDAKAEWDKAPESVRAEIGRAIRELESGLAQKDQIIAPLKPYLDMAKQHGVDFGDTVRNYIEMEQALYESPRKGVEAIARHMGLTVDDFISRVTGGESASTDESRQVALLQKEVAALREQLGTVNQTITQREVDNFAASHPRFHELAPEMARMLETGYAESLGQAYELADRLNPAPAPLAPPPAPAQPSAQPRLTRSVTGSPSSGSNPASSGAVPSIREAVEMARRQVYG